MVDSAINASDSPVALMGHIVLWVAFVVTAYSAAVGIVGNVQKRRGLVTASINTLYCQAALMVLASAMMIYAFVTHDFSIKYVTMYSDTAMPLSYKIAAYWGGLNGSLLFWVAVLSFFSTIAVATNRHRHRDTIGYTVGTIQIIQLFFLVLLVFSKNPFATWLTEAPPDGKGLNPLLQTYWMAIHPPALYIGFVAATIPFAFGIGALASGRLDNQWMKSVRLWTFLCWFFLSFGLILGGRWAYEELGWGGYWAWDPVENAGLLPWFTATAFLHSIIIQEQRGMLRVWNMVLVITTFFLTIFGTFMTRSGIVQSVHAFGEDNALALLFILFMIFGMAISFGLLFWRLPLLRGINRFESFLSREFAFLLNNWILLASAFFVLFATLFPTLSEVFIGERITLGPPFFNKWMIPIGLILLFLAGAAPLLAWRKTTGKRLQGQFLVPTGVMVLTMVALAIFVPRTLVLTPIWSDQFKLPIALINFGIVAFTFGSIGQEFWGGVRVRMRQTKGDPVTSLIGIVLAKRRKYGGFLIHLGIAVMFIGFAGKCFEVEQNFNLTPGSTFEIRDYQITYERMEEDDTRSDWMMRWVAHLRVEKDGVFFANMAPEVRDYRKHEQQIHEVDVESILTPGEDFFEDLYLVFQSFEKESLLAHFTVFVNPLINWVWTGFFFLFLGTIVCLMKDEWVTPFTGKKKRGPPSETTIAIVALGLASLLGSSAYAQATEHSTNSGHQVSGSASSKNRENDPALLEKYRKRAEEEVRGENPALKPDSPEFSRAVNDKLKPVVEANRQLMKDLVCLCGCPRESIYTCRCGFAASERGFILSVLQEHDLWSEEGRAKAKEAVIDAMMRRHAKEGKLAKHVLMVAPDEGANRLAWAVPYVGFLGALALVVAMARRWVRSGAENMASEDRFKGTEPEDEDYSDILDDELRDTD